MSGFNPTLTVGEQGVIREPGTGRFVKGTARPARHTPWRGRRGPAPLSWRSFWSRRALRPEDRWVKRIVQEHAGSLLSDKPDASEAEKHVIEVASISRGCTTLILDALRRAGGPETEAGLALIRELRGFLSLEQKALLALGLARRAKPLPTASEIMRAAEEPMP
jgi:hypothetical protein